MKLLESRQHRAEQAHDCKSAIDQLRAEPFDVLLLDDGLVGDGAVQILKRIESLSEIAAPHIIYAVEKNPGAAFDSLFQLGVCDFVRKPYWREELLARVEAPAVLRRRQASEPRDWGQKRDPLRFNGWRNMPGLIGNELAELTAQRFDEAPSPKQRPAFGMAARISLTATASDTEIRLTLGAEHASLFKLSELMLGCTTRDKAVLEDILREMANTLAGVMKRVAPQDESLTTGLPHTVAMSETTSSFESAPVRFGLRMRGQPVEIMFAVETICRGKRQVAAHDLKEGMVLARDLRNEAGLLLVPQGTRITSSAAERVARLLGRTHMVEVAAAS